MSASRPSRSWTSAFPLAATAQRRPGMLKAFDALVTVIVRASSARSTAAAGTCPAGG